MSHIDADNTRMHVQDNKRSTNAGRVLLLQSFSSCAGRMLTLLQDWHVMQELQRRGVVDPARIAVGGHSYGAFMAANLLAHAPDLFACGIARSGAYNR